MSDIFLSYAREDQAHAEVIATALEAYGWSVWWDRTIPAGKDFDQIIEQAIEASRCVVVLWSKHSTNSRWVKTEAREGDERSILMPVKIEDVKIPLEFRRLQTADLTSWDRRVDSPLFRRLVKDVAGILRTPVPEPQLADAAGEVEQAQAVQQARLPASMRQPIESRPWWLVFVLPFVCLNFASGPLLLDFRFLAIPIAAWIGHKYRDRGFRPTAIGLLPLLYGSPALDGLALPLSPSLYVVCLIVCKAIAQPARWWLWLETAGVSLAMVVGLLALGGLGLILASTGGQLGWLGNSVLIGCGGLVIGLTGKGHRVAVGAALVIAALGLAITLSNVWATNIDFGGGLRFTGLYTFGDPMKLMFFLLLLGAGRMLWRIVNGQTSGPKGWGAYLLFALLWLASIHGLALKVPAREITFLGEPWLAAGLCFFAGALWQKRGMTIVGIAVLLSLVEGFVVASFGDGRVMLGGSQFRWALAWPHWAGKLSVYVGALAFCYLGQRVGATLGIVAGSQGESQLVARWRAEHYAELPAKPVPARPARAWGWVPFIPFLVVYYLLARNFGFYLEYLVVPFAMWLASRYGRYGVYAFSVGALTYWIGGSIDLFRFRLSPDLYVVGLVSAWAVAYPERWLRKIEDFRPSASQVVALTVLLPLNAVVMGDVSFGLKTEVLFPFVMLVLGWAGASTRLTVALIAALGVIAKVFVTLGGPESYNLGGLQVFYILSNTREVIAALLWYVAGVSLRQMCFETPEGKSVRWLRSPAGYATLAIVMFVAPIHAGIGLRDGAGGSEVFGISFSGSVWLFFMCALMAGLLWRDRGMQLTVAIAALLAVVIIVQPNLSSRGYFELAGDSLFISASAPKPSAALHVFAALLYALAGSRVAGWFFDKNLDRVPRVGVDEERHAAEPSRA